MEPRLKHEVADYRSQALTGTLKGHSGAD